MAWPVKMFLSKPIQEKEVSPATVQKNDLTRLILGKTTESLTALRCSKNKTVVKLSQVVKKGKKQKEG